MPLAKLKPAVEDAYDVQPTAPSFAAEPDGSAPLSSPARLLQQRLEMNVAAEAAIDRWPARRSLAFIVTSSVALWAAILEAGARLVHAIA